MDHATVLSSILLLLPLATPQPVDSLSPRFVGGTCAFHVTQHQKNEFGMGNDYQYDVRIFDSIQEIIGGINALSIPNLQFANIDSQLPNALVITSGLIDADPITFDYAGQQFDAGSSQCSIGGYDSGNRDGDCSFSC